MTAKEPQTYATHRRIDPMYHIWLFGLLVVNLVYTVIDMIHHLRKGVTHFGDVWPVFMALAFLLLFFKVRLYSLQDQDRIIRVEETLRMERLLPADLKGRISEIRNGQFVALRFASDGELADRVREALAENLDREAIKKRIQNWRPDTFRV